MDKQADQKSVGTGECPFRRMIWSIVGEDVSLDKHQIDSSESSRADSSTDAAPSPDRIDEESSINLDEYVSDSSSLLSLQPWIFRKEKWEQIEENEDNFPTFGYGLHRSGNGSQPEVFWRTIAGGRRGSSIRSRRSRKCYVKPFTSKESSLVPQLYKDVEVEESIFCTPPPSAIPNSWPFYITDASKISRIASHDPLGVACETLLQNEVGGVSSGLPMTNNLSDEATTRIVDSIIGVPPLPEPTGPRRKNRKVQRGRLDASKSQQSCKVSHLQGSLDRVLPFCIGVSVGVMFTALANKKEVEKLTDMLKHTQNLVEDLQEELDMKDSFSVKEFVNGTSETIEFNQYYNVDRSTDSFQNQASASHNEAHKYDLQYFSEGRDHAEAFSRVEAELEAELERLEQNINASSLQQKMSNLIEFDLVPDVADGELKVDIFNPQTQEGNSEVQGDTDNTSTNGTHDMNCAFSPKELSLRLYEVIESRLQERIEELERALRRSQQQVHLTGSEQMSSPFAFLTCEIGSSSCQESPRATGGDSDAFGHPFCINLTGEAMDSYDEAYQEFMRMAETTEQNTPLLTDGGEPIDRHNTFYRSSIGIGEEFEMEPKWELIMRSREGTDAVMADPETDESDVEDEEGKILIQRIVEKTRQGSPVMLNAQMMLF